LPEEALEKRDVLRLKQVADMFHKEGYGSVRCAVHRVEKPLASDSRG